MYNPSDIDNIDHVLIISFSKLLCKREDLTVTSTVNRHISSTVLCQTLISSFYNRNMGGNGTYDIHFTSMKHFAKTSRCCPY